MKALKDDDQAQSRLKEQKDRENRWIERDQEIEVKRKADAAQVDQESGEPNKVNDPNLRPLLEDYFFKDIGEAMLEYGNDRMAAGDTEDGGRCRNGEKRT